MFGKTITTARQVAVYSDKVRTYRYSGNTREAFVYTDCLRELEDKVIAETNEQFNTCLLNLYHDGSQGMGWHADNEKELAVGSSIASISFGAQRRFLFKHRASGQKVEVILPHGSLLLMQGEVQQHWLHSLPKMMRVKEPRINLTFRLFNTL